MTLIQHRTNVISSGMLDLPPTAAGKAVKIQLPRSAIDIQSRSEVILTITLQLRQDFAWATFGHEIAWTQIPLIKPQKEILDTPQLSIACQPRSKIPAQALGTLLRVWGPDCTFEFDQARGCLRSWTSRNVPILEPDPLTKSAIMPSFWRPSTDNDISSALPYWKRYALDDMKSQLRSFAFHDVEDGLRITARTFLSPPVLDWGWNCKIDYTILTTGALDICVNLKPTGSYPEHVPRVGLNLRANRAFDKAQWFGLGPGEAYPDKRSAQRLGIWSMESVRDLHTPYEVPQENGNRMDTRWLSLTDTYGDGLRARMGGEPDSDSCNSACTGFNWAASRYSALSIEEARHPCDLVENDATLLRLDAKVAGVGTAACGPGVREKDLVHVQELSFEFRLEKAR